MTKPIRVPKRPKRPETVVISTRVLPQLSDKLAAEAEKSGVTVSALVAFVLESRFPSSVRR